MVLQAMTSLGRSVFEQWQPQRSRVLWAPVALGAGIALYFSLPVEPIYWISALVLAISTTLLVGLLVKAPQYGGFGWVLFLAALGFLVAQGRAMTLHAPMLTRESGITAVTGTVLDISVADDDSATGKRRVTLGDLQIEKLTPRETPYSIRLSSRHVPPDVKPGDRIELLAKLMPPSGPVAADGFDYRRQAYFEQIGAVGFTLGKFKLITRSESHTDYWFNTLRQSIARHIGANMKHPESAVASALLAGERTDIPDAVNQDLIDSGLYHLLSISGLHVAIVCGVVFFVLRFLMALSPYLALHWPIKKIAAFAALAAGIFYMLLAGAPVPTQRSMLTTGIVLVAIMFDRAALSLRTLSVAALFILALRPEALAGASFQLSFAAVLSMVAFHEGIGRKWMAEGRDANPLLKALAYFGGIAVTTVLVSIATFPIVLHHFGRLQVYGVIANAIVIPLTSFVVMPAGMAAMVLMPFGLDGPFLKVVEWGLTWTLNTSHWVASLPNAAFAWPSLPLIPYLFACAGFLLVCLWRGWFRWLGVPVMVCAIAYGFFIPRPFMMIDAKGTIAAVADGGQIAYMFKKPTAYVAKNWQALWGGDVQDGILKTGARDIGASNIACDDWACRVTRGDARISIVRDANALAEECMWAGVVIATDKSVRNSACGGHVITYWDLLRYGGVAAYADGRVTPIIPQNETRGWSQ